MKKNIIYLIVLTVFSFFFTFNVNAASGTCSISASQSGNTVNVNYTVGVSGDSIGVINNVDVGHSSNLIFVSGTEHVSTAEVYGASASKTYSIKYRINGSGTANINVKNVSIQLWNSEDMAVSSSCSKSIELGSTNNNSTNNEKSTEQKEKSDNNYLKSLEVEGATLSPEFNKDTLEYTVTLDAGTEKIKVNSTKEDSTASVTGDGEIEVSEGDNKIEVVVTSQKGSTRTYIIIAKVVDENPIKVSLDGKSYSIVKKASLLEDVDGFTKTTIKIDKQEIPALYNDKTKTTVVALKDEEGNIVYYVYNKKDKSYTKFNLIKSNYITIINIDPEKKLKGLISTKVKINDNEVTAYKLKNNKDFVLVYGIDLETGKKGYYIYDLKDKTLQRYDLFKSFNNRINDLELICIITTSLFALSFIINIVNSIKRMKRKKKIKKIKNESKKD